MDGGVIERAGALRTDATHLLAMHAHQRECEVGFLAELAACVFLFLGIGFGGQPMLLGGGAEAAFVLAGCFCYPVTCHQVSPQN